MGWELRWLSPIYLLYFLTGMFFDAFYFNLKKDKNNIDVFVFKNKFLNAAEQLIQNKNFVFGYQLVKSLYYYASILVYLIYGFFGYFAFPLPTIDSFHRYKTFPVCNCGGGEMFRVKSHYLYPISGSKNRLIEETVVMGKIIQSSSEELATIYEKKCLVFRKHIISYNYINTLYFLNDTPSSFDYREFSDDKDLRNQAAVDRKNYYQALKLNKEKFEEWRYANLDNRHNNLDIERLYDLNRLDEHSSMRIKLKDKHIEIEAFCGETKIKGIQKNKQYPCSYLIKKIRL